MSTPALVGLLKNDRDWSGVYVRNDGFLEGVGARLLREMRQPGATLDRLIGKILMSPPGWQDFLDEPYGKVPPSPCARGATPSNVKRADPAFVYLLERGGKLHVLTLAQGDEPVGNHDFAGLDAFDRVCTVDLTTSNDASLLLRNVELAPLLKSEFAVDGWGPGSVERKVISDLLARRAQRSGTTPSAWRAECAAQLASLLKAKLPGVSGPLMVRYGISHRGDETDVAGLAVRTMRDVSPSGVLEVLAQSGESFAFDQAAILPSLETSHPALFAAATAILSKRAGWLLEVILWVRQGVVPDPLKNHLPFAELRHSDGRTWAVEVLQTESWPPKAKLTIAVSDADGVVIERERSLESFEAAQVERERLITEMKGEGFAP